MLAEIDVLQTPTKTNGVDQNVIDYCDYYIVIIGERYGSVGTDVPVAQRAKATGELKGRPGDVGSVSPALFLLKEEEILCSSRKSHRGISRNGWH